MHWTEIYIARPWHPEKANCWHFLRDAYLNIMGVEIDECDAMPGDAEAVSSAFERSIEGDTWTRVEAPSEFDAVAIGKRGNLCHVGIWTEADGGRIVHSDKGKGVCCEPMNRLRRQYDTFIFYRHAANS